MPQHKPARAAAFLLAVLAAGNLQAQAVPVIKFMQTEPALLQSNLYEGNLQGVIRRVLKAEDQKNITSILLQLAEPTHMPVLPGSLGEESAR